MKESNQGFYLILGIMVVASIVMSIVTRYNPSLQKKSNISSKSEVVYKECPSLKDDKGKNVVFTPIPNFLRPYIECPQSAIRVKDEYNSHLKKGDLVVVTKMSGPRFSDSIDYDYEVVDLKKKKSFPVFMSQGVRFTTFAMQDNCVESAEPTIHSSDKVSFKCRVKPHPNLQSLFIKVDANWDGQLRRYVIDKWPSEDKTVTCPTINQSTINKFLPRDYTYFNHFQENCTIFVLVSQSSLGDSGELKVFILQLDKNKIIPVRLSDHTLYTPDAKDFPTLEQIEIVSQDKIMLSHIGDEINWNDATESYILMQKNKLEDKKSEPSKEQSQVKTSTEKTKSKVSKVPEKITEPVDKKLPEKTIEVSNSPIPADSIPLVVDPTPLQVIPQLLGHWAFNEGSGAMAIDSSSQNKAIYLSANQWTPGKFGHALQFKDNDMIALGDVFAIEKKSFSISLWIKFSQAEKENQFLTNIGSKVDSDSNYIALSYSHSGDKKLRFITKDNDLQVLDTSKTLEPHIWHHIVVTRKGAEGQIYINGQLDKTGIVQAGDLGDSSPWILGRGHQDSFQGMIDNLKLYQNVLSNSEVQKEFVSQ